MCSEQTRFSVSWKSLGDGLSKQEKTYFIGSLGREFTHYDFKFKRPVYQVSRRLQGLDFKLCGAYLVFFGSQIGKRIRFEQHYALFYMGL